MKLIKNIITISIVFSFCSASVAHPVADAGYDVYSVPDYSNDTVDTSEVFNEEEFAKNDAEEFFTLPQNIRPVAKSWVDKKQLQLGEVVNLTVEVKRRSEHQLRLPSNISFGKLELIEKLMESIPAENGWVKDIYKFKLIALIPGIGEISAIKFGGVTKSGEVFYVESNPVMVTILDPTVGKVNPVPRDIFGVIKVYEKNIFLIYFVGILLLVFGALIGVWYIARNWEKWHPKPRVPIVPPEPPEKVALKKLNVLKGALPLEENEKKQWYTDLSMAIREYLSNRFDFDGMESTSEEIIELMKTKKTVGLTQAELWKFLVSCDMVKFAKYKPQAGEDDEIIQEAFKIVETTSVHGENEIGFLKEDGGGKGDRSERRIKPTE